MTDRLPTGMGFPSIGSLAAIGDGHSLALVAPDGGVEWFCPARFDAPPLIWPLLDRERGGRLRIGPANGVEARARYLDETAVLECEWRSATGCARALLCMEWPAAQGQQRLLWLVEGVSGCIEATVEFLPRYDFCRVPSCFSRLNEVVEMDAGDRQLVFQADCALRETAGGIRGHLRVEAGEVLAFSLSVNTEAGRPAAAVPLVSVKERIGRTAAAWRDWCAGIDWTDRYRKSIVRSAITLKLLIYEPTGAVVAAGTTSLPEEIGGVRNWDYRYTWFRDASLTLNALFSVGCRREARRWAQWMQDVIVQQGMPLRVLYTVDGGAPPLEHCVPDVNGYRGSQPVRVGNAAETQFQLDIYGEVLSCVYICETMREEAMRAHWPHMRKAADFIAAHWREPDRGIWEMRDYSRQFVHSKATAWVGLQRALWLQRRRGLSGDSERWAREARALRDDVMRHGLTANGRRFARAYGESALDASLLLLARNGFVTGESELFRNTLSAIVAELNPRGGVEGLLLRYTRGAGDDLPGEEGAFAICSFWLVEALALANRQEEAEDLFEQVLALQGEFGLYAEQIDPTTGQQLGNFPQAFTHSGLINAGLRLCGRTTTL